jgi:hypothetical protein
MANIKTTFDPKSLVIANIMSAGETIDYAWSIDEMYQIVVTKGTVVIGGTSYSAISVNDVPSGTNLSVTATTDASFLTLLRSDNESVVDQIMPGDGNAASYFEFMRDFRPDWYDNGIPDSPPDTISSEAGNLSLTSQDIKTMVLAGWE